MKALIVGGAGFIGGTTTRLFIEAGYDVVVLDNLSTGHRHNLEGVKLIEGDVDNAALLQKLFADHQFDIVLDFAAKIQVGESMQEPKLYYQNNTLGPLVLLDEAVRAGIKHFIFSSTAAVYGNPAHSPVVETAPLDPQSPYGISKYLAEWLLKSYKITHQLNWVALRYFNAAGAYGRIGPDYPFRTHLLPSVIHAQLRDEPVQIFGTDYDTPDGTAVRDYIHVADVAAAHVAAAERMVGGTKVCRAVNLGTGRGYSVLEIIAAVERLSGRPVKRTNGARRPGDPASYYASNMLAKELFGWEPKRSFDDIVRDALAWQTKYQPA
jgi:UDP-glucose 4-epimerase